MRARFACGFRVVAVSLALVVGAKAQAMAPSEGLPVRIGDTVAAAKAAFGTSSEPRPITFESPTSATELRLSTHGVWIFFDKAGRIVTIRLDAPFKGAVGGVRLGMTLDEVISRHGQPERQFPFGNHIANVYPLSDGLTARFDIDAGQQVAHMFLFRHSGPQSRRARLRRRVPHVLPHRPARLWRPIVWQAESAICRSVS